MACDLVARPTGERAVLCAVAVFLVTTTAIGADDSVPRLSQVSGGSVVVEGDRGYAFLGPTIVSVDNDAKAPSLLLATIRWPKAPPRLLFLMLLDTDGEQVGGAGLSQASRQDVAQDA